MVTVDMQIQEAPPKPEKPKPTYQRFIEYGDVIRRCRISRGLSQEELGSLVGLTGNRIQQYENGVRRAKDDILSKIFNALGVDVKVDVHITVQERNALNT